VKSLVVVGAGAAGLAAAIFAAGRGRRVRVVESTSDGGRKILISGGGRCNVLPQALEPDRFVTDSSRPLLRRLLRSWPLREQLEFFQTETRKYFPVSNRARDIRDSLIGLAGRRGVEFLFGASLVDLVPRDGRWIVRTTREEIEDADAVILATGGQSVPATGSDGAGLELVARLGHSVHPVYAALTPLTSQPAVHASLSGISLPVRIRARWRTHDEEAHGGFLFTHHGYSGPAVLDVSHVAVRSRMAGERASLRVRWTDLSAPQWMQILSDASGRVAGAVSRHLPARLAEQLITEAGMPADRRAGDLRREERAALIELLTSYELPWTGDEGYKKAEVTGGGVALEDVDAKTMASRVAPGLFLCGEILDAFGPIGGHNFSWAWATGRLAGLGAAL
jgi:predicted Rossmann fold flavoprotein